MLSVAAAWAQQLLGVPGTELVRRALMVAVAELYIEAGGAEFDTGRYHWAIHHFTAALELATKARDAYLESTALLLLAGNLWAEGTRDMRRRFGSFAPGQAWGQRRL